MLRLLYYRYKKTGKISTKKGGGRLIRHGRIIHILRYTYNDTIDTPKIPHSFSEWLVHPHKLHHVFFHVLFVE